MFTGIIEANVEVVEASSQRLVVRDPCSWPNDPWRTGESVAVNGCCLTLLTEGPDLAFDLSEETLRRTSLEKLCPGTTVNLERAMKPTDRFGGHIVQGHVDEVGQFVAVQENPGSWTMTFQVSDGRYLIDKGSVCIEGVSLTIVDPKDGQFDVAVIPHTYAHTTMGTMKPGDNVNIEFDVIAKYVEKLLSLR